MAVVAGFLAVAIPAHTPVLVVGLRLLVRSRGVAINAGKTRVVRGDLVAVAAHRAVMRNWEVRMVERRAQPRGGVMAGIASGGVARRNVVRYRSAQRHGALPIRRVTSVTRGIRRR